LPPTTLSQLAPPRGVDLWVFALEQSAAREARLTANCSARELERAERMLVPRRRREFLVGRGAVRSILGAYLGIAARHVEIAVGPHGKPFLDAPGAPAFNLSHSGGLAVVAVSAGFDVGIDIERVDPALDVMAIARRFLAPDEVAHLSSLEPAARPAAFSRLWTRREACLKTSGTGFAIGLGELRTPLECLAASGSDGPRTVVDIDPAPGYIGALAYDAAPALVHIRDHALACS
jgi:4'-phosphopantetheinyl transferase